VASVLKHPLCVFACMCTCVCVCVCVCVCLRVVCLVEEDLCTGNHFVGTGWSAACLHTWMLREQLFVSHMPGGRGSMHGKLRCRYWIEYSVQPHTEKTQSDQNSPTTLPLAVGLWLRAQSSPTGNAISARHLFANKGLTVKGHNELTVKGHNDLTVKGHKQWPHSKRALALTKRCCCVWASCS